MLKRIPTVWQIQILYYSIYSWHFKAEDQEKLMGSRGLLKLLQSFIIRPELLTNKPCCTVYCKPQNCWQSNPAVLCTVHLRTVDKQTLLHCTLHQNCRQTNPAVLYCTPELLTNKPCCTVLYYSKKHSTVRCECVIQASFLL